MKQIDIHRMIRIQWVCVIGSAGKLFFLTVIFAFLNCCTVTYMCNAPVPLQKQDFDAQKHIGIAVFGEAIPDLSIDIESQINEFVGQSMQFQDIRSGTTLNPDRTMIEDMEKLIADNPDMPYAFIVWEHPSQTKYKTEPGEEKRTEYSGGKEITIKRDYTLYTTVLSVKCEVMLFDLQRKILIAKSIDTFNQEKSNKDYHLFPRHTFLGELEGLFDLLGWFGGSRNTPSPYHPLIPFFDKSAIPGDYFRWFLERIGKKEIKTGTTRDEK